MDATGALEGSGRKYRSKKQRPCDLCRTRKIHCKLQGDGTECELCRRLERQCTFILGPLRRKHRSRDGNDEDHAGVPGSDHQRRPSQPQAERPDFGDTQGLSGAVTGQHGDGPMGLGENELWTLPADIRQSFGLQDMSSLIGYYGLGSNSGFAEAEEAARDGRDRFNGLYSGTHTTSHYEQGFLPPALSPTNNDTSNEGEGRRASQGVASVSMSSESPSDVNGPSSQRLFHQPRRGSGNVLDARYENMDMDQTVSSSDWPVEFSLEARRGYSNHLIGLSCESDPFLLRHYRYNASDNYQMFRLDFRRVTGDAPAPTRMGLPVSASQPSATSVPVQFMMSDEAIWQDDLKATERLLSAGGTEGADTALLNKIVDPDLGAKLVYLYTRFVHPRFPVLSLSDLKYLLKSDGCRVSIGIRSAVYALAAPFTFLDDELSVSNGYLGVPTDDLWDIAHRSFQRASCFSHLSLLQLCLLLLHRPPQNFVVAEPSKFWGLSCSSVAIAENLGVNMDSKDWRLPREEVLLRRRLWWLTYVGHTWHALVCGRPSHIHDENWCVSSLTENDFEAVHDNPAISTSISQQIPICIAQCELGIIAADVLREFYSVRASAESLALTSLLSRAQRLRTRIESWRQTLPFLSIPVLELGEEDFEKGAILRLQHLTLEILIFRALLRPLSNDIVSPAEKCQEPISTIYENCHVCASVATEILSLLRAKHFASFWPHYTRYQLCYVSTLILLILAQSATRDVAVRNKALLDKWRDTLRLQARAWPLARLAAMRLDASFWKGISSVIHGAGPESPAIQLLKESDLARGVGESG